MNKTLQSLDEPTLSEAKILERADLQEYIYNSGSAFFDELGERIFLLGTEVTPSDAVQDRIDLLGVDAEGAAVIVELKRGSNKLQMLQAISYAGMLAHWTPDDFRDLADEETWERLADFLAVEVEDINRQQRLLLVAEGYDYALLAGAEWLSEQYGVDLRCVAVSLATDDATGAEYLACTSVFPPQALADQAVARRRSRSAPRPPRWSNWDDVLSRIENDALRAFAQEELDAGREEYLRKRALHYRVEGKRRWNLHCRTQHAYVWQRGRFEGDVAFWQSRLDASSDVRPVKEGQALAFELRTDDDFAAFRKTATSGGERFDWTAGATAGA